jgi:hypothetical protein
MIDRSGVFVLFTPQPTVATLPPAPVLPPQPGPVALTVVARAVTQATLAVIIPGAAHLSPHASAVSAATATVSFPTLLPQLTLNQLFADNFQRANGPLGGSNGWTATGDGNAVIATNEASGVGASLAGAYRSGETYSGDQFAQGTVGSVNNVVNDFVGLTLRHNVSTNAEYALLYYFNGSQPVLNFYYRTNVGAYTLIDGVQLAGALAVGTALQFYVIGDVLVGSINGVPQLAVVDDHIPAGGSPGITTFGTMTLDNFACGNATMGATLGPAIGSDNFNRANGNASAGQSMWTPVTVSFSGVVSTDGTIVANELNISGSSGHRTAQRNEAYGPDQWAQIGVGSVPPTLGGSAFIGVILRWNGTTGYMYCYFMPGRVFRIYFIQAGQNSVALASVNCQNSGAGAPNPTNTVYTGVAYGTRLSIRANNTELISVNDSRCTAGQPGYQLYPTCTADNFAAGNVTAQISTAALTPTAGAASAARALVAPPASFLFASTDGNGVATYNATTPIVNDGNPLAVRVLQPTAPNPGLAHNFLYMLTTEAYPSATYGDPMGDVAVPLALANKYNLTIIAANLSGANWYGNSITDTGDQRVTYLVGDVTQWVKSTFGSGGEKNLLIGFSRSGMGAQDLLLRFPNIFAKAASWDFPAQGMVNYNDYGADIFGNQANFAANYQLSTANVTALSGPLTGSNRIWIGGYNAFQADVTNYDALLTSLGVPHTLGAMANITHEWQSGWVEPAVGSMVGIVALTPAAQAKASATATITVPAITYSDNFNRADGDPGPNWQTWSAQARASIVSNQLVLANAGGSDSGLLRNAGGETYGADHFSEVAAPLTFTGNAIGPAVRMVSTMNGMYVAIWYGGNIGLFAVTDSTGGSTQLGTGVASTPTPGDRLRLTVLGSTLTVALNGTTIITTTDSRFTSGLPGIAGNGAAACDNWQGGNASAVTPVPLTPTARAAASATATVAVPGTVALAPVAQAASAATATVTMSPMANLQDAFASASVDTTKWGTSGTVSESSSGLALLAGTTNSAVVSRHAWALTGSNAAVQVTPPPAGINNSFQTGLELDVASGSTSQGGAAWQFVATSGTRQIEPIYWTTAGVTHGQTPITLPASPCWVRIRESGGTIYWDYSTDGSGWTTAFSIADPFPTGSLFVRLWSGHYSTETDANAIFQNFNTSVVYSDNFNRADGDPGSAWTNWLTQQPKGTIVSNQLQLSQTLGGYDSGLLRTGESYASDHFSEIAAPLTFTGNAIGPAVRMQGSSNSTTDPLLSMYVVIWISGSINLYRGDNTNYTQLGTGYTSSPSPGDRLRLTAHGSTLTVSLNGTTIQTFTDTTYTGGSPGILGNGTVLCDNWFGGNA